MPSTEQEYRPISLLSTLFKLFEGILSQRLSLLVEKTAAEVTSFMASQFGFRPARKLTSPVSKACFRMSPLLNSRCRTTKWRSTHRNPITSGTLASKSIWTKTLRPKTVRYRSPSWRWLTGSVSGPRVGIPAALPTISKYQKTNGQTGALPAHTVIETPVLRWGNTIFASIFSTSLNNYKSRIG